MDNQRIKRACALYTDSCSTSIKPIPLAHNSADREHGVLEWRLPRPALLCGSRRHSFLSQWSGVCSANSPAICFQMSDFRPFNFVMEEIMLDTRSTAKLACCMVLALGTAALAAQPTTATRRQPGDLDKIRKISNLIGMDVMNHTNTKIAVLRDLEITPEGTILYGVLGYGGVAGVGETYTAVPFDLLGIRHDEGKWAVNLDMKPDELKKAPTMQSETCRELGDPQWTARLDEFFSNRGQRHHADRSAGSESERTAIRSANAARDQDSFSEAEEYSE